ncbi:MAG TPA: FtsQ-type POTRA domain-containing protein [Aggregatilineales bacterium]|nr:FtsQ-type POTRA domain-containing protein [Aggregatilineales bacterium]
MSSRPPARRHVRPGSDPRLPEPADSQPERLSNRAHVSAARTEAAMSLAERRRRRRLQRAVSENEQIPATQPRGVPRRVYVSMRWFSALIVLALLVVLGVLFTQNAFFIHEISVGGTKYLTPPEIFERSGLASVHLFWVDPAQVSATLEQDPSIANASVEVGWPPNLVQIIVTEREPALIWEQAGVRVWVDVRGKVMALRQDLNSLVRVVVEHPSKTVHAGPCPLQGMGEVLGPGSCIDPDIVAGAIQFKQLYPNVTEMVYDPARGLGFHDGRGWVLWFGDGVDIVTKMTVYNTIVANALAAGKQLIEVDVANPDSPYYRSSPTGGP